MGNGQPGEAAGMGGGVLVAAFGHPGSDPAAAALRAEGALRARFPGREATALVAARGSAEVVLLPPAELAAARSGTPVPLAATGRPGAPLSLAAPGHESPLRALLREGERRGAAALALVSAEPHDESADWLGLLVAPVLESGCDLVSPAYRRHRAEGVLNTGIVYPLTRALYGRRLRQPLGDETALSGPLAGRLLKDPDWSRDPASAGSDAWLVAKVLAEGARAGEAWLGAWSRPAGPPEDPSHTVTMVLGRVFREMERQAGRWQRIEGSEPVPTFGAGGLLEEAPPRVRVEPLAAAFRLGQRELEPVWGPVLPPPTLLALRRLAAGEATPRLGDSLWARIVFDFAVGHYARSVERRQLLRSLTPLYLGWVAGFVEETQSLSPEAVEARIESLCLAFEREKRYLISRWRWPDAF